MQLVVQTCAEYSCVLKKVVQENNLRKKACQTHRQFVQVDLGFLSVCQGMRLQECETTDDRW